MSTDTRIVIKLLHHFIERSVGVLGFVGKVFRRQGEIKTRVRREQGRNSSPRFTWDELHTENLVLSLPVSLECSAMLPYLQVSGLAA